MKYQLNITKEQWKNYVYFSLGLLLLLQIMFYQSGFVNLLLISLKLSLFVHLAGYLIAIRLFKEQFDDIALLFLGFSFGLILAAFWYYVPTLFGINTNNITYIVPVVLLLVGLGLHVGRTSGKENYEIKNNGQKVEKEKEETEIQTIN